ncbi:hypothetical protein GGX14DRAFT_467175 [Mycena pura]|uniref:Transmembrane protein n=1 Tax=Mycena pura TaxID=153505 RepID=A0AAD6V1U7_9AGAR|nr:hypothetical protein GGX14DRAFT_467175 [Mycena pura]
MSTNTAIVDERDSRIQYTGTWNSAGSFIEFAETTKSSPVQGSTATFTFVGSSITVYGSVAANPAPASLGFVIDGSTTGSYSPPSSTGSALYHEALWTSPTMTEGSHTLVITQTAAQPSHGPIYLDYIMYQTTSSSPGAMLFIDDRDPRISYTPAWRPFGSQNDFQHTSSESTSPGDSFSFQFEGSAISYYGGLTTSDTGASIASIVLDGAAPALYTAPSPIPATANNLIFKADSLSAGMHTLVVTSTNTDTLWMDYFLVSPNPPSGSSSPGSLTSPASGPVSAIKSTPTAVIAGGVVAACVLLALLLTAVFLCRRRRARSAIALPKEDLLAARPFEVSAWSPYSSADRDASCMTKGAERASQSQSNELEEQGQKRYISTAELIPAARNVVSSIFPPSEEAAPPYSA